MGLAITEGVEANSIRQPCNRTMMNSGAAAYGITSRHSQGRSTQSDNHPLLTAPVVWAVVNTQPNRELLAVRNLTRQDFTVYCPKIRKTIRHARRSVQVLRPLFPGYVFVRVSADRRYWRPVLSTPGVRSVVRCGDYISTLDDSFIVSLQSRETGGNVVKAAPEHYLGQQVKISGGAFDGIVTTIIELDEPDRIAVLIDLVGRSVKMKLRSAHVVMP